MGLVAKMATQSSIDYQNTPLMQGQYVKSETTMVINGEEITVREVSSPTLDAWNEQQEENRNWIEMDRREIERLIENWESSWSTIEVDRALGFAAADLKAALTDALERRKP